MLKFLRSFSADDLELIGFHRDGREWLADLRGGPIPSLLFQNGHFQGGEINALVDWLRVAGRLESGRFAVEAGANIGTSTIPLAAAGLEVIAIEPVPKNLDLLTWNVRRNGLADRVRIFHAAVAMTAGELEMAVDVGNCGGSEVRTGSSSLPFGAVAGPVVRVSAVPLSEILSRCDVKPSQVAVVWSDTQGFEAEVIASGGELWAAGVPAWVEAWPLGLSRHGGVDRFLDATNEHFAHWLSAEDVVQGRQEGRPLTELAGFMERIGIGEEKSDDVLLLPGTS